MEFIKQHECAKMKNCTRISIEKYDVDGVAHWYHHLHLEHENDKAMAIIYCPYCGEKLE